MAADQLDLPLTDATAHARGLRVKRQSRRLLTLAAVTYIIGTLTWRSRTADALSNAPIDSAAAVRLACDFLAVAMVGMANAGERLSGVTTGTSRIPWGRASPVVWYTLYVIAVGLSFYAAIEIKIVFFRAFDLAVCLFVAVNFARRFNVRETVVFIHRALLAFVATIVASVLLFPTEALIPKPQGLWSYQVAGVIPIVTVNTVGTLGLLLLAIHLGSPHGRKLGILLGIALIVAAQYRTGYAAVPVLFAVYLLAKDGAARKFGLLLLIPAAWVVASSEIFRSAWVRGEAAANSVTTLSGRTEYWTAALQAVERSPIIGLGMGSGTRFEVLANTLGYNTTSTIHNTWVEAYVGTGVIGLTLLFLAFMSAAWLGWRYRSTENLVLLLMCAALAVRGLTGTTIELAGYFALFFVMLAASATIYAHEDQNR